MKNENRTFLASSGFLSLKIKKESTPSHQVCFKSAFSATEQLAELADMAYLTDSAKLCFAERADPK